jgi:type IV pilus assembly protein PilB
VAIKPVVDVLGTNAAGTVKPEPTAIVVPNTPPEPTVLPTDAPTLPNSTQDPLPSKPNNDADPASPTSDLSLAGFGNNSQQSILDILVTSSDITDEQRQQVQVEHISTGKSLEALVTERNLVSEEVLTKAKAKLHGIGFVKISETGTDPQALTQLPEVVARNYQILPLSFNKIDGLLTVAMRDPLDLSAIDFAQQKSGLKLITNYAMPSELERAIAEHYSQSLSKEVTAALEQTSQVSDDKTKQQNLASLSGETIRQAPITKIVQTIVSFAMKARASDVHIEPQETRTRVRYRIDGILSEKLILPASVHEAVVSRVKILSDLKIDEKRLPQDGRFNFISDDEEVDLRVSTLPTIHGEKVVMRLLKKDANVPSLPELGLRGLALRNLEDSIKVPHGIILVTGPTGSGKTTTLYSVLHNVNTPKVNIVTLEDPVEYQMKGINQVQTNPQAGLTFASGLRSFLRQDPNIIMVGEIRDSETAELAVQASLTGHLVFSTLHTSSSAGAIPRMLDMGAEPFLLASSMTSVVAQRVLRKINENFKEEYKPEPAVLADIKEVLGRHFDTWLKQNNKTEETLTLSRPKKDLPQNEPEYKGRIAIFEVMKITEAIGKLILERKPANEMEDLALKDGMLLMKQDGYLKALEGITTIEEVLRVAQI